MLRHCWYPWVSDPLPPVLLCFPNNPRRAALVRAGNPSAIQAPLLHQMLHLVWDFQIVAYLGSLPLRSVTLGAADAVPLLLLFGVGLGYLTCCAACEAWGAARGVLGPRMGVAWGT